MRVRSDLRIKPTVSGCNKVCAVCPVKPIIGGVDKNPEMSAWTANSVTTMLSVSSCVSLGVTVELCELFDTICFLSRTECRVPPDWSRFKVYATLLFGRVQSTNKTNSRVLHHSFSYWSRTAFMPQLLIHSTRSTETTQ